MRINMENIMNESETRDPVVFSRDGKPAADSRDVAAFFDKEHRHVLEAIDNLLKSLAAEKSAAGEKAFILTPFTDDSQPGRAFRAFAMTRDGFTLLAMGFTGAKALKWKLRYIEAFNRMEERLKAGPSPVNIPEIVALVVEAVHRHDEARERAIEERLIARLSSGAYLQDGKTPGEIWRICGFPQVKGIAKWFGNRLEDAGCATGGRKGHDTSRARAYDFDKARKWLNNGGRFLVEQKIAERLGQGKLHLVGKAGA